MPWCNLICIRKIYIGVWHLNCLSGRHLFACYSDLNLKISSSQVVKMPVTNNKHHSIQVRRSLLQVILPQVLTHQPQQWALCCSEQLCLRYLQQMLLSLSFYQKVCQAHWSHAPTEQQHITLIRHKVSQHNIIHSKEK